MRTSSPGNRRWIKDAGAWHTAELAFCFDNIKRCEQGTGNTPEPQVPAKKMATAWANFARTGNPSQPGLSWAPSDPARCPTMVFDNHCRMVDDPEGRESVPLGPSLLGCQTPGESSGGSVDRVASGGSPRSVPTDFRESIEVRRRNRLCRSRDSRLHEFAYAGLRPAALQTGQEHSFLLGQQIEGGGPRGGVIQERELPGRVPLRLIAGNTARLWTFQHLHATGDRICSPLGAGCDNPQFDGGGGSVPSRTAVRVRSVAGSRVLQDQLSGQHRDAIVSRAKSGQVGVQRDSPARTARRTIHDAESHPTPLIEEAWLRYRAAICRRIEKQTRELPLFGRRRPRPADKLGQLQFGFYEFALAKRVGVCQSQRDRAVSLRVQDLRQ